MNKKAFTLFELMIVVIIIGLVYALVLGSFDPKKRVNIINFENLKSTLMSNWQKGKRVDLYIYDGCKKSTIFINNQQEKKIKININPKMFKGIKVSKLDRLSELKDIEFTPIVVDNRIKDVCFKYTIFPNGSSSSYIVTSNNKYYLFYPYFQKVYITDDLEEVKTKYQNRDFTRITASE